MRLHRLRLAAFGPFAAEQMVDFDRLAHGGLFLLEGPTGAGKSTILDAVTFALYGGLAGADAADDRLRSHFAAPDAATEVELEWSLRGVRYKVTRSPEYQRRKKRGDGFTVAASRVHLQRRDGAAWASMSANKAEAGELIAELVGLTRVQFTQVMLLPQGEFARFLRSADDDRRKLLTRLFGTSLYDRISAELADRRTRAKQAREQAERQIADAVSAAAEAAGLDAAGRAELLVIAYGERQTRLKELGDSLAEAIAATAAAAGVAAAALGAAQAEDEEAGRQATLMARLTAAHTELREHTGTRPGHDERAARLAAARHADPVRPLLELHAEATAAAAAAAAGLVALLPEPDEDAFAGRGGAAAAARAEAAEAAAAALQHDADDEEGLPAREAGLDRQEQDAADAGDRVAALELARQNLPDRITSTETRLAEANTAAAGLAMAARQLDAVSRRREAAFRLAELEPRLAELDAARLSAIGEHHRLVDTHQHLLDTRLAGIAAELAAGLADGRPCRVCGSPAHPEPALACGSAVSAEEVEEARQRREAADERRAEAEREHAGVAVEAAGCAAVADGASAAALAGEADALAGQIAQAEAAAEDMARLERELADARAEQEHVGLELRAAAEAAAAARATADRAAGDLAALRVRLRDAAQATRRWRRGRRPCGTRRPATAPWPVRSATSPPAWRRRPRPGTAPRPNRARVASTRRRRRGPPCSPARSRPGSPQRSAPGRSGWTGSPPPWMLPTWPASTPVVRRRSRPGRRRRRRAWPSPGTPSRRRRQPARPRPGGPSGSPSEAPTCGPWRTTTTGWRKRRRRSSTWPGWPTGPTASGGSR